MIVLEMSFFANIINFEAAHFWPSNLIVELALKLNFDPLLITL